jgi:fucose 4-O-acetylase-like acetyltransferase
MFPLFPFAAFMFGGVFGGHLYLKARRTGSEVRYFKGLALAGLLAIVIGIVADLHPLQVYPPHDFWKTSPNFYLIRLGVVLGITASFYFARRLPKQLRSQLVVLGGSSLMVYVLHLVLVYGSAANSGLGQMLGQSLPFAVAFATGIGVLLLMIVTVYAWRYVSREYSSSLRMTQYAFVSLLLFLFMTNPY